MKCGAIMSHNFGTIKKNNSPQISFCNSMVSQTNESNNDVAFERYYWDNSIYSDKIKNSPIGNFRKVDSNFYRGAQPGIIENEGGKINYNQLITDLKYLRDKFNITVIMNLRNPNDNNTNHIELEKQAINELNEEAKKINMQTGKKIPEIISLNIPMYAEASIPVKSEDVETILKEFNQYSKQNIYVHCRSGNDRTGVVTALYRVWKGNKLDSSIKEMRGSGHNSSWYPGLVNSVEKCIQYMAGTKLFDFIPNAKGQSGFLKAVI